MNQRFIYPWELRNWNETKHKFTEKINSIVEMDSKISAHLKARPRLISDLFTKYYESDIATKVSKEEFLQTLLPMLQTLVNDGPKTFKGVTLNMLTHSTNIVLTRKQTATLIACMWFGLLNYNYISKGPLALDDFPEPTFMNGFVSQQIFMLACLLGYFKRVYSYLHGDDNTKALFERSKIILKRSLLSPPNWSQNNTELSEIFIGDGQSDNSSAKMHTVYAHEFIGGDMFKESITQEGVVLLTRPECLIATIFCSVLRDDTVVALGCEKMSGYIGYGASVKYTEPYTDPASLGYSSDNSEILFQVACVFIDASPKTTSVSQFINDFERDLNKAYNGFAALQFSRPDVQVACGNWTYGFNGANMQVKLIQLILAASAAHKCLVYYPFGRDFEEKITPFIQWCWQNHVTVAQLYNGYNDLIERSYSGPHSRLTDLDVLECLME